MNDTVKKLLWVLLPLAGVIAIAAMLFVPTPTTADHRAALVKQLQAALPEAQLVASADSTVHVGLRGEVYSIDLRALQETCAGQGPRNCQVAKDVLTKIAVDALSVTDPPAVARLRPTLAGFAPEAAFARGVIMQPWVGGLQVRYAFFNGPVARYLTEALAAQMKLDAKTLLPLALEQMESGAPAPVLRPVIGMRGVSYLDGEGDPSAEVLSGNRMARFTQKTGLTRALVAFPTRHMVIFANADTAGGPPDIRGAVANMTGKPSQHVISRTIFLWEKGQLTPLPN